MNNNKIKVIICAAGQGRRLRPLTDNCPKPLVTIGDKTIIEYMLDHFSSCGLTDITIVVGYRAETVKEKIGNQYQNCTIHYIENKEYAVSDNLYSLWLARRKITNGMLFLNGDIIFHHNILRNVLNHSHLNVIATDFDCEITEDAMKVKYTNGVLDRIGKKIEEGADGWAVGIYQLSQKASEEYFKVAGDLFRNNKKDKNISFVIPLQKMAPQISIIGVPTDNYGWVEIDDHQDYEKAKRIINKIIN